MTNSEFSIEKLKGAPNYHNWSFAMENFLEAKGYGNAILPSKADATKPTETDADKLSKAKGFIVVSIDPTLFVHIRQCKNPLEMWSKLKSMYEDRGLLRKIGLLRNLISMRLDNCDSMQVYIDQITDLTSKLDSIGFKVEDDWIAAILLAGLTDEYKPLIMSSEAQSDKISSETIKMKLLDTQCTSDSKDSALLSRKKGKTSNKRNRRCFICNDKDHLSSSCPKKPPQKSQSAKIAARVLMTVSTRSKSNDWYIDSGASSHMTPNVSLLSNCKHSPVIDIQAANDSKLLVKCAGDTTLKLNSEEVSVKNVLCVPDLTANLLSVYRMVKAGNKVVFDEDGCTIFDKQNVPFLNCKPQDGVYKLKMSTRTCLLSKQEQNTALTWHRRFGHLNIDSLTEMKNGIVSGMDFKKSNIKISNCEVCAKGKQSRLPFDNSKTHTNNLLEIIHSDIAGPFETRSLGGAKYFLTFIDDFSRKVFIYFLKEKSEVIDIFMEFKVNQTGQRIKVFRTDGGTEYSSRSFERFFKVNGIQHQVTNAYTPQQNGVAKRMNRTIVGRARCMIFDAELNDSYWAEACNMAVYVINRSVCAALVNKTPEEVWTGQKVDVSNLRIFGTPVMVSIPKQRRKKWDAKSTPMVFVGFDSDKKGYRCLDDKNKMHVSRDVLFNEKPLSSQWKFFEEELNQVSESDTSKVTRNDSIQIKESSSEPVRDDENDDLSDSTLVDDQLHTSTSSESASDISVVENKAQEVHDETEDEIDVATQDTDDPSFRTRATIPTDTRKSAREPKQRSFEGYVSHFALKITNHFDPSTVKEALSRDDGVRWKDAMDEEMRSLMENKTWNLVELPEGRKAIKTKWIFKTKRDEKGNILRYKARFVAKGCAQKFGQDYVETFAPVVRYSTIRLLMALAVKRGLKVDQMDAITAFLQGDLSEVIYVEQPESFTDGTNRVGKLNRAMYGLKQAGREWNRTLVKALKSFDLIQSKIDPCVFYNHNLDLIVAIYVDDILIFWLDPTALVKIKRSLCNTFKMKDMGSAKQILGIRVNQGDGFIELDQSAYIKSIIERFNMENSKAVATPGETSVKLSAKPNPNDADDMDELAKIPYQEAVGCLLYLSQGTRPDIAHSVTSVSRFNSNYKMTHWRAVKRIFRYLNGSTNLKLRYSNTTDDDLNGYTDADWASEVDKRRSCTSYVFNLAKLL